MLEIPCDGVQRYEIEVALIGGIPICIDSDLHIDFSARLIEMSLIIYIVFVIVSEKLQEFLAFAIRVIRYSPPV